jgi:hypothetical protein
MSMEPLTPEDERKIRDGAARLDVYPTFGMSASVNMLRLFATLDAVREDLALAKETMEAAIKDADYYRKEANAKADDLLRCHGFKEEAESALDACRERLEIHLGCETTTTKTLKNLMIRAEDLGSKPWRDTRAVILARSVLYGKEGGGA